MKIPHLVETFFHVVVILVVVRTATPGSKSKHGFEVSEVASQKSQSTGSISRSVAAVAAASPGMEFPTVNRLDLIRNRSGETAHTHTATHEIHPWTGVSVWKMYMVNSGCNGFFSGKKHFPQCHAGMHLRGTRGGM